MCLTAREGKNKNKKKIGLPGQPEEALGSSVFLGLDLIADKVLEVHGFGGGGKEAVPDFLDGAAVSDMRIGKAKGRHQAPRQIPWEHEGRATPGAYLDVAEHVGLDGGEGNGAENICFSLSEQSKSNDVALCCILRSSVSRTKDGYKRLGGLEEFGGSNGIVLVGVDGDIDERLFEGVDNSAAGRNLNNHGRCFWGPRASSEGGWKDEGAFEESRGWRWENEGVQARGPVEWPEQNA